MTTSDPLPVRPTDSLWYATALNSIADAVIAADTAGRVTYLNPAAEALTGWTCEEAVGRGIARVYDVVDDATGEEITRLLVEIARGGEAVAVEADMLLVARGGAKTPVEDAATPIRDETQAVIGVVVAFRDVTAARKARREIDALNARLRAAVAEANHRFKNNLQVVAALVEVEAEPETGPLAPSAAQRLALHIRALAGVHDLLSESARTDAVDTVSAADTLAKLVPLLQATVTPRLVALSSATFPLSGKMSSALALITNELVSNAIKHASGNIGVALTVTGAEAHLQISDAGLGFPEGFDVSADAHTGLQLVQTLARHDLGGSVRYETAPEGGGCVTVSFPVPKS